MLTYVFPIVMPWEMQTISMDVCAQPIQNALLHFAKLIFANHLQIKWEHIVLRMLIAIQEYVQIISAYLNAQQLILRHIQMDANA